MLLLTSSLIVASCSNNKNLSENVNQFIPNAFSESRLKDTSGLKNVQTWREFFVDPNLVSLIDSALTKNFDIKLAYQRLNMAYAHAKLFKGARLPDLNLQIGGGVRKFGDYTMDGVGNYDTQFSTNITQDQMIPNPYTDNFLGLHTSWEVDIWGKIRNSKQSTLSSILANEYAVDFVKTNIIAELARNYYMLMMYDEQISILIKNIEIQEKAEALVIAQKESGKVNELAVEMISAQLLNSRALLMEVQNLIIETESLINNLLGRTPQKITRSKFVYDDIFNDRLRLNINSEILKNRPDIRESEQKLISSKLDVLAARKAFYPSLNINANLGYQAFKSRLVFDPASLAYQLALGLSAPLINKRSIKSNYAKSLAEKESAYIDYNRVVVNSFTEVYNLARKIKNINTLVDLKQQESNVLRRSITTSLSLFVSGRANYFEVITSQKNSLLADFELLRNYNLQTESYILLYKSIGGGVK